MSYLVLARKYRPQRFSELVGQEHVARTLTNAIAANRVHHAFLFTGARGVGKTSAARILAKALSCKEGPTANPCGTCDACQEIASGRSVDVVEIDGASNTGVDDVRTLREGARYMPAKGPLKIYIIDEVHMLSTSAFNALLKTLEEPPAHVVFIFATTEAHKIPTTILSRCQRFDFKLIPTATLTAHLERILVTEKIPFDADGLLLLARQAAGSVRDGLSLLDQVIAYVGAPPVDSDSDRKDIGTSADAGTITRVIVSDVLGVADRALLIELARSILARDAASALRTLGGAVERGLDLGQMSRSFLGLLRDIEIVARVSDPDDLVDATAEELTDLRELATAASGLTVVLFDRWARAVEESGRAVAPRLILEMAVVDLCQSEPLEPLGDLLERLEGLESRLQGGDVPGDAALRRQDTQDRKVENRPIAHAAPARAAPRLVTPPATAPPVSSAAPDAGRSVVRPTPAPATPASVGPVSGSGFAANSDRAANSGHALSAQRPPPTEGWRRVKSELERRRPRIGALLANAHVLEIDNTKLVLGFQDKADVDAAERVRTEIEQALSAELGSTVRLFAKLDKGSQAPPLLRAETVQEAEALSADKYKREQEARQHPIIQKAQDLFGVAIREIKT
jgi:DNA polymerase-3 subunit gamma/tau